MTRRKKGWEELMWLLGYLLNRNIKYFNIGGYYWHCTPQGAISLLWFNKIRVHNDLFEVRITSPWTFRDNFFLLFNLRKLKCLNKWSFNVFLRDVKRMLQYFHVSGQTNMEKLGFCLIFGEWMLRSLEQNLLSWSVIVRS